jgi:hypothetical protein
MQPPALVGVACCCVSEAAASQRGMRCVCPMGASVSCSAGVECARHSICASGQCV